MLKISMIMNGIILMIVQYLQYIEKKILYAKHHICYFIEENYKAKRSNKKVSNNKIYYKIKVNKIKKILRN